MGMKSRLFASAAFPLLSLSLAISPVHAAAVGASAPARSPQVIDGTYEVAQDAPAEEEIPKKRRKAAEQEQQQQEAAPQQQAPQAEQEAPRRKKREAAPEPEQAAPQVEQQAQPADNQEQPKRKKREAAPEQAAPEPQQQQAAPAEQPAEKPRKKREAAPEPAAPEPQQQQAAPQAEPTEQPAEKPRKKRDQKPAQQEAAPQQNEAQPKVEEAQPQTEQAKPKAEQAKPEQAKPQAEEAKPQTEEAQPDQQRPRKRDGKQGGADQQPAVGEAPVPQDAPAPDKTPVPAKSPAAEKPPVPAEPDQAQKPAGEGKQPQPGDQQDAAGANAPDNGPIDRSKLERPIPKPEKVTTQELDRRKQLADDPSKSSETVVLPVENGAAVLDSDKDADRTKGTAGRRDRDRQRGQEREIKVPTSDADSQVDGEGRRRPQIKIEAVTSERGERLDERPRFDRPPGWRVDDNRDYGDPNLNDGGNDRGGRIVIQLGDNIVVRSNDDRRFIREGGEQPSYERLPDDRYRETIVRPGGYRIITIRNRYGEIVQRSRVDERGREYVLYYAPDAYDQPDRDDFRDPGDDLPPMRLPIPVRDYIIDTSSDPDRDYYDFLREPPVEPVERTYSLDEVKYSARIRDKVRRIDLDTITFATGSAEVPMSQAQTLRKVADALKEVLDKDPSETFLIEGHTDAVGSAESNLVLSDQRAESVANVLSDVYGIAPENITTQGYGEQYLKVNTDGANQENRRVTIRRITALVRPVASKN